MAMIESKTWSDRVFDVIVYALLILITVATLYPCWYVVMASVSDPVALYNGSKLLLWPRGFSLDAYKLILQHAMLWMSYGNTLIYVGASTVLGLSLTIMASYVLSRSYMPGKNVFLTMITITMFFGGGLIPTYLIVVSLGLVNTRWAMILPGLLSTYNIIMMMTYFRGIPASLEESARIDGANDWVILIKIMIPLALPVIAVIALYLAVGYWNSYFNALIYINSNAKKPLTLFIRELLLSQKTNDVADGELASDFKRMAQVVKYAVIVVATAPIMCMYPFLQKYFVKGVMIGSLKG